MRELPKIISVDDHVVEPAHVWNTWLPERFRECGPRVIRQKWAPFIHKPGARYENTVDPEGTEGDAWLYEDRLIYVQKSFVAIPQSATPDGIEGGFDRTKMQMIATTYDEMRPGCWDPHERVKDFEANHMDGSLPFPTFPRFCGQTFMDGNDKELGLACVRAYNDWMIEEWCAPTNGMNIPLCIIPLWDPVLAVEEVKRVSAKGVHAICFSEIPTKLGLPSIHTDHWDPLFQICNDNAVTLCMHIGSSSSMPAASPDAPEAVGSALQFNNAFASLIDWLFSGKMLRYPHLKLAYSEGQIGWIPYALERADIVWDIQDSWNHAKDTLKDPPSTQYYGRVFGCFTADAHGLKNLEAVGPKNICFEIDYPHSDTTWPTSKAYAENFVATQGLSEEVTYDVLRGNAIRMLSLDRT